MKVDKKAAWTMDWVVCLALNATLYLSFETQIDSIAMTSIFDYTVVGGGTAGVVIASRLKQYLSECSIALLEAGPNTVDHSKVNDITDSNAWIALLQGGIVVDYSTAPQEHLDDRKIMDPAGRFLSGSSGVNMGN